MKHELAIALIREYGEKMQRQRGTLLLCPCCGKNILTFQSCGWSRYKPTLVCAICADSKGIPPEHWAIVQNPERWSAIHSYYFSVGRHSPAINGRGYVEIQATSQEEAKEIFRSAYPDVAFHCFDGLSDQDKDRLHNYGRICYGDTCTPPAINRKTASVAGCTFSF